MVSPTNTFTKYSTPHGLPCASGPGERVTEGGEFFGNSNVKGYALEPSFLSSRSCTRQKIHKFREQWNNEAFGYSLNLLASWWVPSSDWRWSPRTPSAGLSGIRGPSPRPLRGHNGRCIWLGRKASYPLGTRGRSELLHLFGLRKNIKDISHLQFPQKKWIARLTDSLDFGDRIDKVTFTKVHCDLTVGRGFLEYFQRVHHFGSTNNWHSWNSNVSGKWWWAGQRSRTFILAYLRPFKIGSSPCN